MTDVVEYFHEQGINIVTIQPEFKYSNTIVSDCLVKCVENSCADKICCKNDDLDLAIVTHVKNDDEKTLIRPKVLANDNELRVAITEVKRKSKSLVDLSENRNSDIPQYHSQRRFSSDTEQNDILTTPPQATSLSSSNLTSRPFISDSHLPKIDARLMSEMPDDFEFNFNIETFNIDQIGKVDQIDEKTVTSCIQKLTDETKIHPFSEGEMTEKK